MVSTVATWLVTTSWATSLMLGARFVARARLIVPASASVPLVQEALSAAGWAVEATRPVEATSDSTDRNRPARRSTTLDGEQTRHLDLRRVVDRRPTSTSLQPLADDVVFRLAQVGVEVVAASFTQIEPRKDIPPQWSLSDESTMPVKTRRRRQADHLTFGDRAWSENSWATQLSPDELATATIGPASVTAARLERATRGAPPVAQVRRARQGLLSVVMLVAGPLLALSLFNDPPSGVDLNVIAVLGAAASVTVLGLSWSAATIVKHRRGRPASDATRSWVRFAVAAVAMGLYILPLLYCVRSAVAAPTSTVLATAVTLYVGGAAAAFVGPTARRALATRRRRVPWLILLTTFGLLAGAALLNLPSALFLLAMDDPQMIGSLSLGQVLVSGLPFAVGVVLALALAAGSTRAARSFPTVGVLGGAVAFSVGVFCLLPPLTAWDAGSSLRYGQHAPQAFVPPVSPVCAALEADPDAELTPVWLIGSQGSTMHFMPRDEERSETGQNATITSSDVSFRSVSIDDRCN